MVKVVMKEMMKWCECVRGRLAKFIWELIPETG